MMLSLAGPRAEGAVPALIQALDDGEPRVRAFAALALAKIAPASEPVRAALHLRLATDSEGIVRIRRHRPLRGSPRRAKCQEAHQG